MSSDGRVSWKIAGPIFGALVTLSGSLTYYAVTQAAELGRNEGRLEACREVTKTTEALIASLKPEAP